MSTSEATLLEGLRALLDVPYTDSALGPVVTVADLQRLVQRHAADDGGADPVRRSPAPR